MKSFRNRLRQAVLAAIPAVAAACTAGTGSVSAPTTSSSGGSGATTGSATTGTTGDTNFCAQCTDAGLVCDQEDTRCVTQCNLCPCMAIESSVEALDGGYPDGGLPLDICDSACPDPDGTGGPHTVGWTVLACQGADCPDQWPDGGLPGTLCVQCTIQNCNGLGREPEGLAALAARPTSAVAAYFSQAGYLEAASAIAFERMAAELEQFNAPASLVRRAQTARSDELRHARITGDLAARFGGQIPPPQVAPLADRTLEAFAEENAREGCVRETLGAAMAAWQAESAQDPQLRAALASIAEDEAQHAELSWDVAAWAESQLDEPARARLCQIRAGAIRELRQEGLAPRDRALVEMGLLPNTQAAERLLSGVEAAFWRG